MRVLSCDPLEEIGINWLGSTIPKGKLGGVGVEDGVEAGGKVC